VIPVVCSKVDMLSEVEGRKKRQELRSKVISSSVGLSRWILKSPVIINS